MLAINYLQNKQFYQQYGLIQLERHDRKVAHKLHDAYLTLHDQTALHTILYTKTKKDTTALINANLYARTICDGIDVATKVSQNKIRALLVSQDFKIVKKKTQYSATEGAETFQIDEKDVNSFANIRMITHGRGVPIVTFSDQRYELNTPSYMNSLLAHARVHRVLVIDGIPDFSDNYIRLLFKRVITVSALSLIPNGISSSSCVLYNNSPYPEKYFNYHGLVGYTFILNEGTRLSFKTPFGIVKFDLDLSYDQFNTRAPTMAQVTYIDVYSLMLTHGRRVIPNESNLTRTSILVNRERMPRVTIRGEAAAKLQKFISQVVDFQQQKVNMVLIANKGSGKSKVAKMFAEKLAAYYQVSVGTMGSDIYGRWLYYTHVLGKEIDIDYQLLTDVLSDDRNISYHEYKAKEILSEHQLDDISKYERISFKVKQRLIDDMIKILTDIMTSDEYINEREFNERFITSKSTPRVMIVEAHYLGQDATAARTDVTFNLETVNDTYNAVKERNRAGACELLLHDTYFRLNASLHTRVYPFELLSLFRFERLL
nr:MAG: hypothetical protein [Cypovirus sp.]